MASVADPLRDPARLRAIHDARLHDDSAQETFDRLTRLVSRMVRAPLALVNLIDERRQLTPSCVVPPTWPAEREASLQDSFCKHVVVACEPLLIEDAHVHPLVSSSRMTTDLGVRSYLEIPHGGLGIGLTIARYLCDILGFAVTVESAPGAGARFEVEFDRRTVVPDAPEMPDSIIRPGAQERDA